MVERLLAPLLTAIRYAHRFAAIADGLDGRPLTPLMRSIFLASFLAVGIPTIAAAQSLSYEDASSPMGAVGMMKTTLVTAEHMKEKCSGSFETLKSEIETKYSTWRTNEAHAISKTEEIWPELVKQDPRFSQLIEAIPGNLQNTLDSVSRVSPELGVRLQFDICKKYFTTLAAGIWRQRTPMVYKYLDEMK